MTAITKSWVSVTDAACDPDAPITSALVYALRDNAIYVREWLGAGYTAGAVQDHSHDGVNSALVETGPNLLRNGSFESGTTGWTITQYTGGTVAVSTSQHIHGKQSLGFTSTSTANGGGDALSNAFIEVAEGEYYPWGCWNWGSVANISSKLEILWYDYAKADISTTVLLTNINTPTAKTLNRGSVRAPANARYAKIKVTGGIPGSGSATGTTYFDGVFIGNIVVGYGSFVPVAAGTTYDYPTQILQSTTSGSYVKVAEKRIVQTGYYRVSYGYYTSGAISAAYARTYKNGSAYGVEQGTTNTSELTYTEDLYFTIGDLVQIYIHASGSQTAYGNHFKLGAVTETLLLYPIYSQG